MISFVICLKHANNGVTCVAFNENNMVCFIDVGMIISDFGGLVVEFTAIASIDPLFIKEGGIFDGAGKRVATTFEVSILQS